MNRSGAVKILSGGNVSARPKLVGVIASAEELRSARRMRKPPDLFELRLDYLPNLAPRKIAKLSRPLIITARHPAEGGGYRSRQTLDKWRRDLLLEFLPYAQFVDVELRSLRELREVWEKARSLKITRICSVHNFARTPSHAVLQKQFQRAIGAGADVFKLVTRAGTLSSIATLLQFLVSTSKSSSRRGSSPGSKAGLRIQCCVMATGRFGPLSRILFPEFGSVFVYGSIHQTLYPGQLTLRELGAGPRISK